MQCNRQQRRSKAKNIKGLLFDYGTRVPYDNVSPKAAKSNEGHRKPKKVRNKT